MATIGVQLDLERRSTESKDFEAALRRKIVGQDEAVQAVVDLYQVFRAGLNFPGRPLGNLLFLGPTGAGETRVAEAAAEVLLGDRRALIEVDCAEFQHPHEIAKLKYAARHLKRAIERHIVYPLVNLLATEQVCLGDVISL